MRINLLKYSLIASFREFLPICQFLEVSAYCSIILSCQTPAYEEDLCLMCAFTYGLSPWKMILLII